MWWQWMGNRWTPWASLVLQCSLCTVSWWLVLLVPIVNTITNPFPTSVSHILIFQTNYADQRRVLSAALWITVGEFPHTKAKHVVGTCDKIIIFTTVLCNLTIYKAFARILKVRHVPRIYVGFREIIKHDSSSLHSLHLIWMYLLLWPRHISGH